MELVEVLNNRAITSSRRVAFKFKKQHKNVLRDIEHLHCSEEFRKLNFEPVEYIDEKGEKRPEFRMTRDGFVFLVMGFTGKEAAKFKEEYIDQFNRQEEEIRRLSVPVAKSEDEKILDVIHLLTERISNQVLLLEQKNEQLVKAQEVIKEQAPVVEYANTVLSSTGTFHATSVAADIGLSAVTMNKKLRALGVIRKIDGHYVLHAKYRGKGYEDFRTIPYLNSKGEQCTAKEMVWTEKGRKFVIELLTMSKTG